MGHADAGTFTRWGKLSEFARRRTLSIAFLLSVLVHAIAYWSPTNFEVAYSPVKTVHYDASLVPLTASTPVSTASPQVAREKSPQSAARRRTTPKSDAKFDAPENAIAVARGDPDAQMATDAGASTKTIEPVVEAPRVDAAAPEAVAPAVVAPEPIAAPPPAPIRRAPAFAERISIEYKLATAITDGVANFRWTRKGADYEIESSIQATGFLVSAFAGVIYQQSRGVIGDDGLRPQQFSIRRGEGEAETAEFRRDTNALAMKRNGETRAVPLTRDMQDMQSFLFQLAYDAPQLAETGDKLDVLVTNARKVYRYQFRKMGTERVETRFGAVETIRLLSEAANPEDQYEVWLAPGYFYLPVKLKYYLGRFQVEQLATRIGVSGETASR